MPAYMPMPIPTSPRPVYFRTYKVRWRNGRIEDNVVISDGAVYTWEEVAEVLYEYPGKKALAQ